MSKDSVGSHQKFKARYELPFMLLSDPDKTMCEAYGVMKEKMNYGKKYMGIERTTFIIDEEGTVVAEYRGVKVGGHIRVLLDAL